MRESSATGAASAQKFNQSAAEAPLAAPGSSSSAATSRAAPASSPLPRSTRHQRSTAATAAGCGARPTSARATARPSTTSASLVSTCKNLQLCLWNPGIRGSPGTPAPPGNPRFRNYNDRMAVVRYVALIALVVWVGGMVVLGVVVAPTTSRVLAAASPANGAA